MKAALLAAFVGQTPLFEIGRLAAAEMASFPVRVSHALGTTTIARQPERIVTLGWSSEDIVLALGMVPVAMPRRKFFTSGIFPWNEPFLHSARPQLLEDGIIDYEEIALLRPDLILAVSSGVRDAEYQRLSVIAPTIVYRTGPWRADWQEQAELVGAALGRSEKAKELIAQAQQVLIKEVDKHPQLRGKTFAFVNYSPPTTNVFVYLPGDPKVRSLLDAGLKLAPGVAEVAKDNPGSTGIALSVERINILAADVIVVASASKRTVIERDAILKSLNAPIIILDDPALIWATSALSVLAIPHTYPRFISLLAEAVGSRGNIKQSGSLK
ncbi:iron-siderophore ABC transporter substrate-binding protein [Agrobacterium leguminum]|uniref:iron-siderophore ABC transporter substrate-binding protein n=1 Tax=Agrobacterium leguminum TaxID=2792015 RepID=UPI003CE483B0